MDGHWRRRVGRRTNSRFVKTKRAPASLTAPQRISRRHSHEASSWPLHFSISPNWCHSDCHRFLGAFIIVVILFTARLSNGEVQEKVGRGQLLSWWSMKAASGILLSTFNTNLLPKIWTCFPSLCPLKASLYCIHVHVLGIIIVLG